MVAVACWAESKLILLEYPGLQVAGARPPATHVFMSLLTCFVLGIQLIRRVLSPGKPQRQTERRHSAT